MNDSLPSMDPAATPAPRVHQSATPSKPPGSLQFSPYLPLVGVFAGMSIAIGVPALSLLLLMREVLPSWGTVVISCFALLVGGVITLVSTFFGIVIPRKIN